MKILFLGSSHFSKIVLEKMIECGLDVSAVITQPDRPSGRGHKLTPTEVKTFAIEKGIDCFAFEKVKHSMDEIKNIDYDISVVASFGQILPLEFLEHKPCINVHPSLLPKYRGPSPMQTAILNGDKTTGVTIMKVAMEVDAGDIILQKTVEIKEESYLALEKQLGELGGEMINETIALYQNGSVKFTPQKHDKATFTRKFSKADGMLDFDKNADEIVNKVLAIGEEVGCYFSLDGQNIKVFKVQKVDGVTLETRQILNDKKRFVIGAKGGAVEILQCMSPSGKRVSGRDFINGYNEILGRKVD